MQAGLDENRDVWKPIRSLLTVASVLAVIIGITAWQSVGEAYAASLIMWGIFGIQLLVFTRWRSRA